MDQPGLATIQRRWRAIADEYADTPEGPRMFVAEAYLPHDRLVRYLEPDRLHTSFNFEFLISAWKANSLRTTITESLTAHESVGASAPGYLVTTTMSARSPATARRSPGWISRIRRLRTPSFMAPLPMWLWGGVELAPPPCWSWLYRAVLHLPRRRAWSPRGRRSSRRNPPRPHLETFWSHRSRS